MPLRGGTIKFFQHPRQISKISWEITMRRCPSVMDAIGLKCSPLRNLEKRIIRRRGKGAASSFLWRDHPDL